MKTPLDRFPYPRDPRSRPIGTDLRDGIYVFARDAGGTIRVLPDGPHRHPRILGHAEPAIYAGDLTISNGRVKDVTNLSGTFQFDDPDGLTAVATDLERIGFVVEPGAVRFFPLDGSRPVILR